jgi:hypothetical protein
MDMIFFAAIGYGSGENRPDLNPLTELPNLCVLAFWMLFKLSRTYFNQIF